MANVIISSPTLTNGPLAVEISASAEQRVELTVNPSGRMSVLMLKLLAAAQITIHEKVAPVSPNDPVGTSKVAESILRTLRQAVLAAEAAATDFTA